MHYSPEQKASLQAIAKARVPQEFAIDCKAIALTNLTLGGVVYAKGDKDVRIFDKRTRDKLRASRAIMVTEDASMNLSWQQMTDQQTSGTMQSGLVEPEGTHDAKDTNGAAPPPSTDDPSGATKDRESAVSGRRVRPRKGR